MCADAELRTAVACSELGLAAISASIEAGIEGCEFGAGLFEGRVRAEAGVESGGGEVDSRAVHPAEHGRDGISTSMDSSICMPLKPRGSTSDDRELKAAKLNGLQMDESIDVEIPISAMLRWVNGPRIDFAPAELSARLSPNATLEQARAEFAALYPGLIEAEVAANPNSEQATAVRNSASAHKPWLDEAGGGVSELRTQFALAVQVLMAAVGLLLLPHLRQRLRSSCSAAARLAAANCGPPPQPGSIRRRDHKARPCRGPCSLPRRIRRGPPASPALPAPWLARRGSGAPARHRHRPRCRGGAVICPFTALALTPASHAAPFERHYVDGEPRRGDPSRTSRTAFVFVAVQVTLATILTHKKQKLFRSLDHLRQADLAASNRDRLLMCNAESSQRRHRRQGAGEGCGLISIESANSPTCRLHARHRPPHARRPPQNHRTATACAHRTRRFLNASTNGVRPGAEYSASSPAAPLLPPT